MFTLTIINTIAICYLFYKQSNLFYFEVKKETTFHKKTFLGYRVILWKRISTHSSSGIFAFFIPVKNKRKTILSEEVEDLKTSINKRYTLHAIFSWLKTIEQVNQFQKDYSEVDKNIVDNLVFDFKLKHNLL